MCCIVRLSFIIHYIFQCAQLPFVLFTRAIDSGTSLFVLANCQLGSLGSSFLQQVINPPKTMTLSMFIQWHSIPTPSPTNECVGRGRETVRFLPLTLLLEQLATFIDGAMSRGRTADCVSFSGRQIPTLRDPTEWPIDDLGMRLKSLKTGLSSSRILRFEVTGFVFFSVWHQHYTDATWIPL